MELTTGMKLIARYIIKQTTSQKRDTTSTGAPVFGDVSNSVAAVLVHMETEIEKQWKKYLQGEDINNLVPDLEDEEEYDKDPEEILP